LKKVRGRKPQEFNRGVIPESALKDYRKLRKISGRIKNIPEISYIYSIDEEHSCADRISDISRRELKELVF
jgi:hypothetical protein